MRAVGNGLDVGDLKGRVGNGLAEKGAEIIVVSDYWPLYYFNGVRHTRTEAILFFLRRGYSHTAHEFHLESPLTKVAALDRPDPEPPADVTIRRARPDDRERTLAAVRRMFSEAWWFETTLAFKADPPTCYIAERNGEVVGFADYDATNFGLFGPTGVEQSLRGKRVGAVLFRRCLRDMRALGYPYALIPTNLERLNFYHREGAATIGRMFLKFEKKL